MFGNVILVVIKLLIGLITSSIAIILDAINNLSDAFSSVITIIGTALSLKPADKKHPFGYGRIEYLTSILISAIILGAGVSSAIESVKKIINPEVTNFTTISLIIIGISIFIKLSIGVYTLAKGKSSNSDNLKASGKDAFFDSVLSLTTLISGILSYYYKINIDGVLGVFISIFILKAGIDIMRDTLKKVLGERISVDLSKSIKMEIKKAPKVQGVYDLILHDYGPLKYVGSVHIEVLDTETAKDINRLSRELNKIILEKFGIYLTFGIYSINTTRDDLYVLEEDIKKLIFRDKHIISMHGFYLDHESQSIYFDLVLSFDIKNKLDIINNTYSVLKQNYSQYNFIIAFDDDYSD